MQLIFLVMANAVVVVVGVLWMRREVGRQVARLMATGCPWSDLSGRLVEIDRRLDGQDSRINSAVSTAETARDVAATTTLMKTAEERLAAARPVIRNMHRMEMR